MERPRTRTKRSLKLEVPGRTTAVSSRPNTGALASSAWLAARDLFPSSSRWAVEVSFSAIATNARFAIEVHAEEWGFALRIDGRQSWIRVTDMPFVHGTDAFGLLRRTPRLESIHMLMRDVERELGVRFDRDQPSITSSFGSESVIAAWARTL